MAGFGSIPARAHTCYIGLLDDVSSADNVVNEVASVLGMPFRPVGLFYQVTTGITTGAVTTTLNWRPTPGSATGEVLIATWEQPVAAADTQGFVWFNTNTDAGTVLHAGGPTSQYGIGGSNLYVGGVEADMICGPGGELEIDAPDGEPGAGAVNYWLIYELLGSGNEQQATVATVVPTAVTG